MFGTSITVDGVDEPAGESCLVEEGVVRTEEVVPVADCAMVVDLVVGKCSSVSQRRISIVTESFCLCSVTPPGRLLPVPSIGLDSSGG